MIFHPQDKVPLKEKHDQLMAWIDLPFDQRPQLLMGPSQFFNWRPRSNRVWPYLAYEPSLDQAGHLTGPMSALVNVSILSPYYVSRPCL